MPISPASTLVQMLLDAQSALEGGADDRSWGLSIPIPLIRELMEDSGPAGVEARAEVFGLDADATVRDLYLSVMDVASHWAGAS